MTTDPQKRHQAKDYAVQLFKDAIESFADGDGNFEKDKIPLIAAFMNAQAVHYQTSVMKEEQEKLRESIQQCGLTIRSR